MTTGPREPSRIPVRGAIGLLLTVGGMGLLLSFRTPHPPGGDLALALADQAHPIDELIGIASPVPNEAPASAPAASPATTPSPRPSMPAAPPEPRTATLVGDVIPIRWGDVQVAVTVDGGDIVAVETLQIPLGDRRSSRINEYAEPILREQAIAIDTADVDVVSGATYTSLAYAESLQSALDQLGA